MSGVVLVTGGRDYADRERVAAELSALAPGLVLHGAAKGADTLAESWARENGVHFASVPALWYSHLRGAGPKRNAVLVEMCRRLGGTVLAFPGGNGTADCVRRAKAAGLTVREVAP